MLAKWLATRAQILIFDEPTRGIDVGAKAGIHELMRELARAGAAILMISSELPEVIGMSDRILVMRDGTIAGELPPGPARPRSCSSPPASARRWRPHDCRTGSPQPRRPRLAWATPIPP